ncbi:hypothetical protein OS035_24540 [Rhizobium sp. 268]|uniref:hypothetical protein n=1 Tax=Rhizobium sp. 268 TaxID=2996375 RepID=UPI002F956A4E
MTKPDIPKRLAARIRAAQTRLEDCCNSVSGSDFNHRQAADELAEYDANPEAYARKNYGNHGIDSYPVTTRISRLREKVAYHSTRGDVRKQRIADAVAELEMVEAEVLAEVSGMRPTSGRVPWPKTIPAAEQLLRDHRKELDDLAERVRLEHEARKIAQAEEDRIEEERDRIRREKGDAEHQAWLATQSPEYRREWNRRIQMIVDGIRSGRVGLHNIGEFIENEVNGRS